MPAQSSPTSCSMVDLARPTREVLGVEMKVASEQVSMDTFGNAQAAPSGYLSVAPWRSLWHSRGSTVLGSVRQATPRICEQAPHVLCVVYVCVLGRSRSIKFGREGCATATAVVQGSQWLHGAGRLRSTARIRGAASRLRSTGRIRGGASRLSSTARVPSSGRRHGAWGPASCCACY